MRKYVIVNSFQSQNLEGFVPIQIQELDKIVNHSADMVFCNILEYLPQAGSETVIPTLFEKIKLGGKIVIELHDIKKICLDFINNKINTEVFLNYMTNKTKILSIDNILSIIDSQFLKITNRHNKDNYIYSLTIERINI